MTAPIIIAAGGTGGHFFPAEALAKVLLARGERVVFMTDARTAAKKPALLEICESHVVPGAGIAGRNFWRALAGIAKIAQGVVAARTILARLSPRAVVGFGGYPAVAPVLAARLLLPRPLLVLHDQNAVLGQANVLLAGFSDRIALSFARAGMGKKTRVTGNPVRPAITARAASSYTPPAAAVNILVLGGSLGAMVFATLIPQALALLPAALRSRIALTMQCPLPALEAAQAALAACGIQATLSPFFQDAAELMAAAHLIIARAGGSTVAELTVIGRPAILIPLTINRDQNANAGALVAAGAALAVPQVAGPPALAHAIQSLLEDPEQLSAMAKKAAAMGIPDAAEKLADWVLAP